jgi:hypothetical protein
VKLRLYPVFESCFFYLFDLAGARTEPQPVEGMQNRFLFVQFADRKFASEVRASTVICAAAAWGRRWRRQFFGVAARTCPSERRQRYCGEQS